MKTSCLILLLFGSISVFGQDCKSYLDKFGNNFSIQFAYDPEQIELVSITSDWEKIDNREKLRKALLKAEFEIAEIESDRWLLRKKLTTSNNSTYIKGHVADGSEPLVSALIYTKNGQFAALTDDEGAFLLEIPQDVNCEICCQYLGYEVQCIPQSQFLAFTLSPKEIVIEDVEIKSKKVEIQIVNLDDSELIRIKNSALNRASLGSDVLRSVQLLSGVDATNDLKSAMIVRASSSMQSLITLDGIPLYNPQTAFGMFSVLNPMVVTESALYKNTMPLEYGEFTGGYLACKGLQDLKNKFKLNVDVNTLHTSAAMQIPLGKSTQISGAFRRSNGRISNKQYYSRLQTRQQNNRQLGELLSRPETLQTSLENEFGDLYFNFLHEWKNKQKFSISILGNKDQSGTTYSNSDDFIREINNNTVTVTENYLQSKVKANLGISFKYEKTFKSEARFQTSFYSSAYSLSDSIISGIVFESNGNRKVNRLNSRILNDVQDANLKFQYETSPSRKWSWKTGLDLRRIKTNFSFKSNSITPFSQKLTVPILTPYVGLQFNHKEIFYFKAGFRNAIIPAENPVNFASPRISSRLKISEFVWLKSSASINQQFFRPIELERQLGQSTSANIISTNNIPVLTSAQLTGGLQIAKSGLKINGDFFIRQNVGILEQVLSIPGINPGEDEVFGNNSYDLYEGVNSVAGFDITSRYEKGTFTGLLSYTFTKSIDRFPDLFNNRAIVDQNNRLNQINLFAAYQLSSWTFSSTFVYGSGVYTLNRAALENNVVRDNISPFRLFKQLPSYNRWDLSASYKLPTKIGNFHFDMGILNVTDHNNVNSELYIYNIQDADQTSLGAAQVELLGRIWTVGIRFDI